MFLFIFIGTWKEYILKQKFIKHINEKYQTNQDFDSNLLKIDKKGYKNIVIYYIGYITMKDSDYVKINSLNPLYLIFDKVDGYIEESNENKYLILASTDKNNKELTKYTQFWDRIKYLIQTINGGLGQD